MNLDAEDTRWELWREIMSKVGEVKKWERICTSVEVESGSRVYPA